MVYEFLDASETCPHWPGIKADQMTYFSYLTFAWAYILSSRWVEVFKNAGEKPSMQQSEKIDSNNFWKVIAGQWWQATIIRGGITFYAPWCLMRQDVASKSF